MSGVLSIGCQELRTERHSNSETRASFLFSFWQHKNGGWPLLFATEVVREMADDFI